MKRLMSILLLAVFVLTPVLAFAQDDEDWEEYVSEDELLTALYPTGWVIVPSDPEELPFPSVSFVNNEEGAARWDADEDPIEGDALILVLLMPVDLLGMMGDMGLPEDPTALDYATALATIFAEPDEGEDAPTISEPEEITAGEGEDEMTFGYVEIADSTAEGSLIVHEVAEGLLAMTLTYAFPGEYTDELAETAGMVAGSLAFAGTAEDVMLGIMGGAMEGAGSGDAGSLDGEALVEERCTVCHSAERIEAKMASGADRTAWEVTVNRMIEYGATLNDDEREAVLGYLAGE